MSETVRYFQLAGVTLEVSADLPLLPGTFEPKLNLFEVDGPGPQRAGIHHHFSLPDLDPRSLGREVYRQAPWLVYRDGERWTYLSISGPLEDPLVHGVGIFDRGHSQGEIYHKSPAQFRRGNRRTLTLFPSDQPFLAQMLSHREACYLHASSALVNGSGLIFAGQSESGKSTAAKLLASKGEILCEDRSIVCNASDGFRVYGSWSNAWLPHVSPASAPLVAVCFPVKSSLNRLRRIDDSRDLLGRLLPRVIKPLVDAGWWDRCLQVIELLVQQVPCYTMEFDKQGTIVDELESLTDTG